MKSLDEILKDPKAHGGMPSEVEMTSWNEEVLRRWAKEQVVAPAPEGWKGFASRPLGSVLFWGCVVFGAVVLGSLIWDSRGGSLESLHDFTLSAPNSALNTLAAYPRLLTGLAIGLALAVTRPVREFLLHQLD